MKVLQINAVDSIGSTGTIMSDIQDVCTHNGIECHIAYGTTQRSRHDILYGYHIGNWLDHKLHALLSRIFRRQAYFSTIPTWRLLRHIDRIRPDVVHLHNLHSNYINLNMLLRYLAKHDIPTVATLHDNWFFTGGCYLPELEHCSRWQTGCYDCPLGKMGYKRFLPNTAHRILRDRQRYFNALSHLSVVGVSDWMAEEARRSILSDARILTIRNGVRTDVFSPMSSEARAELRTKYAIRPEHFVILAPASKWLAERNRNGLDTIISSLRSDEILLLYGCTSLQMKDSVFQQGTRVRPIPFIKNKVQLSAIYSMADVMINCTHMDTCSFINIEAQACGTPVITFDNTGAAETVDNINSFRVPTDDYIAMRTCIDNIRRQTISPIPFIHQYFTMQQNYEVYVRLYRTLI